MIDQSAFISCRCAPLALAGLLFLSPAWAQEDPRADLEELDLPEYEDSIGPTAEILDLDDVALTGNPLKSLIKKWPSDLVVAPVPGYSPQLGWNLKLVGGYFLNPKEDSDHAASVLGGGVMFSENGSSAYAVGANLHLLDDKLRVKAGALYADVRYDLYGSGPLGLKVPIRQNGPGYFVGGSWRVWKKLYVGLGYLGGEVDTEVRGVQADPPP